MTISKALVALKESLYALFVNREPEPFNYVRDASELTDCTATPNPHKQ